MVINKKETSKKQYEKHNVQTKIYITLNRKHKIELHKTAQTPGMVYGTPEGYVFVFTLLHQT